MAPRTFLLAFLVSLALTAYLGIAILYSTQRQMQVRLQQQAAALLATLSK